MRESPQHRLFRAIIDRALCDALRLEMAGSRTPARDRDDALAWLLDDRETAFSFRSLCRALGADPQIVGRKVFDMPLSAIMRARKRSRHARNPLDQR